MTKEYIEYITELHPEYDRRKSFYGKARVEIKADGTQILWSYDTAVASISPEKELAINGWYSQTTGRHINEFLRQNGFDSMSKQEMEDYNGN